MIFIVDDEKDIRELLSINLKKYGFKTKEFSESKTLIKNLERCIPELIIIDIMLPGMDGIELLKFLKSNKDYSKIPVIMLTAKKEETDKIIGLELGADDYITKPFSVKELIARIKAVLRRYKKETEKSKTIKHKNIVINTESYEVFAEGNSIKLTPVEYKLLIILISNKGRVCSRNFLLEKLWGDQKIVIDRTIDVHIKHLRDKLGKTGSIIKNLRGFGYKIEK